MNSPPVRKLLLHILLALVCLIAAQDIGAGEPPPAVMLAERYQDNIDPAGYLVSEKLDGVRAVWDGRQLRLRSGRAVVAPPWFLAALPEQPVDGELWLGRRRFDELSSLIRREAPDDPLWREVRYMLFDLPGATGDFSTRAARLRALATAAGVPWIEAIAQHRVADRRALQALFDDVVAAGGEGLMLHRTDASWHAGRSDALLKLTPWLDAEARVVAHLPGKGRLAGMTGALLVEAADGRRFRLSSGLTDALRRTPPAPGTLVTYRYRELTVNGLPRFPRFLRVRELP
jgi:DNA ligase-1